MKKVGVLLIVFLVFFSLCFSLVVAEDILLSGDDTKVVPEKKVDVNSLVKDFLAGGTDIAKTKTLAENLNKLVGDDKAKFFNQLKEGSGIDMTKLSGGTFNDEGKLVLKNKQVVDVAGLYNYGVDVKAGKSVSYPFCGGEHKFDLPVIKGINVEGDSLTYEFENGASVKLSDGATFDLKNRKINGVEWVNMEGGLEVNGNEIKTKIVYDSGKENDLKSFPILKDSKGEITSPYHGGLGLKVDLPKDFKKPSKGKFNTFTKNGKSYSVDSGGIVREIKNVAVKFNDKGEILSVSNGFIDKGDSGDIFTTGETLIARGENAPTDKSKSYVWFGKKDGKDAVSLNSVGGELYYVMKKNLNDVELNGKVVVKNGAYFLSSDENGNINVRKVGKGEGKMEFTIDKIYTDKKKEQWFVIKKYEGDNKELTGKLVVYNKDGKLIMGGIVNLEGIKKIGNVKGIGNTGSKTLDDIESQMPSGHIYKDSDKVTWAHETMHGLNSRLRGKEGYGNKNAFYLGDGEYVTLTEPSGVTLGAVGVEVPNDLKGMSADLYLGTQRGSWENQPLYILDELSAYTVGSKVRAELGLQDRGESVQQMMEFAGYSVALLNKAPNDVALKNYVESRIKNAVDVYNMNKNVGGATAHINKLKNNQWFVNSAENHFGSGWVKSTFG